MNILDNTDQLIKQLNNYIIKLRIRSRHHYDHPYTIEPNYYIKQHGIERKIKGKKPFLNPRTQTYAFNRVSRFIFSLFFLYGLSGNQ